MKKIVLTGAILVLCLIFSVHPSSAESNLELEYQTTNNSIDFEWKSDQSSFMLYSGKKILWKGSEKHYSIKNLKPKKVYKYTLLALDKDNKVIDQTELSIMTKEKKDNNNQSIKQNIIEDSTIDAIVKKDKVVIQWDKNLPDEDGLVSLYKNDEYLGTFSNNKYVDKDIEPNKYYTYRVIGQSKLSQQEIDNEIEELKLQGVMITSDILNEIKYKEFDLGKVVKTLDNEQINIDSYKAARSYFTTAATTTRYNFRYTTFIPDQYAYLPGGLSCPKFHGDNRSYSFSSSKYRTRTEVSAYFNGTNDGTATWVTRDIGATTRYNCDGTSDTKTQTDYTITKSNKEATSKFVSWSVTHSVGMPFPIAGIDAPAIDYTYNANVASDGSFQIHGTHDQAPSHEMYAYIPNSDAIITIFKHENKGLIYLAPPMANRDIDFSIYN